ncbi:hypothetical protein BDR03DRAFT_1010397 [Suillus americanus]|nr:hypothetical protein BDR03DRAFT_1010397 [Suillus americanus]
MVHTHPTNASKRPAQVVLDMKQKRWTTAQVKQDWACAEKEQEEQDQKAKQAITQVAAAQQKAAIQQENTDMIEVKDVSQPPTPPVPLQMRLLQHGLGSTCPHITRSETKDVVVDPEGQEDSIMIADDADDFDLEDYDATRNTGGNKRVTVSYTNNLGMDPEHLVHRSDPDPSSVSIVRSTDPL